MDTIKINSGSTLMVAHRGLSGLEKENTCAAFIAAGNRSYYGMETDIHPTLDGRIVCIHDASTARVAIDDLDVEKCNFDLVRSVVLCDKDGSKDNVHLRIPTLEEYVRLCKKYGKVGVCEIKGVFSRENIIKVIDTIKAEDYLSGIVFIAFDIENLIIMRELLPEQPCQFLTSKFTDDLIPTLKKYSLDLDIAWPALTAENIKACHENGIKVNAWTVDDPEKAAELVSWGIDFITSNILE